MNKKGFTLVELLVTILLVILLGSLISTKVINIINNNRLKGYREIEKRLEEAAAKYVVENYVDNNVSSLQIDKGKLIEGKYIDEIYDLKDKSVCDAHVIVNNLNGIAVYKTVLECANYRTNIQIVLNVVLNGGILNQDLKSSYKKGEVITLEVPTRTGYTFNGWTVTGDDVSMSESNLTIGTSDITLTANWTPNTYTISYELDGGTEGSSAPTSGTYGRTVTVSNPIKAGYTFNGWTVSEGATEGAIISNTNLTIGAGNIKLTANWTTNSYEVDVNPVIDGTSYNLGLSGCTFDVWVNGSLVADDVVDWCHNVSYGSTVRVKTNNVTGRSTSFDSTITVGTSNTTIAPSWTTNTYTITYELAGGTAGSSAPTSGKYGSTVTVSNPTRTGYTFNGWTITEGETEGAIISDTNLTIGTGNISLTANWKLLNLITSYQCANTSLGSNYNFTYTGNCEIIDDENNNWRVKFLTSGTLTLIEDFEIDAFLVGGGGGGSSGGWAAGGGGGYTQTITNFNALKNVSYEIVIGDGGTADNDGNSTSAFDYEVSGGKKGISGSSTHTGGAGGSGGGDYGAAGGSNGSNGSKGSRTGGAGQEVTTCEFNQGMYKISGSFCDSGVDMYSGGGAGQDFTTSASGGGGIGGGGSGTDNTGGGGGGGNSGGGAGGSGVVIIRNARNQNQGNIGNFSFKYSGRFEIIDDGNNNWRVKFLTSGTFTPLTNATIDAFLVGGGGGGSSGGYAAGGGGGYTSTINGINVIENNNYLISIGKGGVADSDGENSTGFGNTAEGGKKGIAGSSTHTGGAGGSGGGDYKAAGGSNGSNGGRTGGTGQGTTTCEFGQGTYGGTCNTGIDMYSGGGAGQDVTTSASGGGGVGGGGYAVDNTGGGGGGGVSGGGYGGSGIVIIRNTRS